MSTDKLDNIIVIGDRVLVKPSLGAERSRGGLYLPVGYQDKEDVKSGYILKCGPGYPLPSLDDDAEAWTERVSEGYEYTAGTTTRVIEYYEWYRR